MMIISLGKDYVKKPNAENSLFVTGFLAKLLDALLVDREKIQGPALLGQTGGDPKQPRIA
jgi:hypothetical protein